MAVMYNYLGSLCAWAVWCGKGFWACQAKDRAGGWHVLGPCMFNTWILVAWMSPWGLSIAQWIWTWWAPRSSTKTCKTTCPSFLHEGLGERTWGECEWREEWNELLVANIKAQAYSFRSFSASFKNFFFQEEKTMKMNFSVVFLN